MQRATPCYLVICICLDGEMESRGGNGSLLFCMENKSPAGISGRAFASCSFLLKFHQTMDGMTDQIPNGLRSQA